jgi:hypothetical protein
MSGSDAHGVAAGAAGAAGTAVRGAPRSVGTLARTGMRSPYVAMALLVVAAAVAFWLGRSTTPASFDQQLPPHVGVPAHARLVRREDYIQDHIQNWYYAVPGTSHTALTAYFHTQLAHDGWHCFRAMTSTNMTVAGQAYSGSSVYITALRGTTKAQIYTADQQYGSYLLQDDLPANAIALKISLETAPTATCV